MACPDLDELAICPSLASGDSGDEPADGGNNGGGDDISDLLGALQGPGAAPDASGSGAARVMGEDMEGRVILYAERIGTEYYNP